ncbi:MAG: hypothetical protein QOJ63_1382 [Solirubrobacteraceae bacterium]|jgi:hypothetical protein|nr:hypothetical protein [Solirubrobacteraceae bacterium]
MRALVPIVVAVLLAVFAASARAQSSVDSYVYTPCAGAGAATVVEVIGAPCSDAEAVAAQVVAAPIDGAAGVLLAAGWTPLRAQSTDDASAHDVLATRRTAALRIRRTGPAPDLDGWEAGRELILARKQLVGGKPVPSGAVLCTSSWLVRLGGGSLGGLTAGHCGGLRKDRTVQRRNVGLRRPPQPGIILGRVKRILTRTRPLDALLVPVPALANRTALAVVDRGVTRPPWTVAGLAQPTAGRAVCFTGRTSGVDQCGSIDSRRARAAERIVSVFAGVLVRCTTIRGREGDSGGPVYTAPRADGTVRAIGIVTLVVGETERMCFTPLAPVLDGLGARLVTGAG